ncbi:hypothetical protein CcaCcLH18_07737 [Colletotrichum camelliae]|nr:hypothetical protein CcaCcLH18_07737 [Colletotrichum camelliae]
MFFVNLSLLLGYCLVFSNGASSHLLPRAGDDPGGHPWSDHDKVPAFTQNASPGLEGQLELRFNPSLYISGGCDIYPAVDASGSLGAGLKPTGGGRSGCDKGGSGQVYARRGTSQDRTGIMYSYYVPKVRWGKGNDEGHRHYWASIVVWINRWGCDAEDITSVWPVGLSFTADHATWQTASAGVASYESSGVGIDMPTRPRMQIHDNAIAPFTDGDSSKAFGRTLVGWDSLPALAQKALGDVKYEHTEVPFIDANFQKYMDAAYRESFYGGLKEDQGCESGGKTPTTEAPSSATTAPAIDDPLR